MIETIWDQLNSLTTDSEKAVFAKCKEYGFDVNKGDVSLKESYINLRDICALLKDGIEERKLIQLPLAIQKEISSQLNNVIQYQAHIIQGSDETVNLVAAIDQLNLQIWKYGLRNLSKQVLGYQEKINQLKQIEVEIDSLKEKLLEALNLKNELESLHLNSSEALKRIEDFEKESAKLAGLALEQEAEIEKIQQNSSALLEKIQQYDIMSQDLSSSSKASNADVLAVEKKIKEFFKEIQQNKEDLSELSTNAKNTVKTNEESTGELIERLGGLENQIKDQIEKATGYTLFHSFQKRQETLAKNSRFWFGAVCVCVLLSITLTIYIAHTTTDLGIGFYLKVSASLPLIFAISFCALQYGRERKLEEEYAFKSNISISLDPYQRLVEKIIDASDPNHKEKFTTFVVDSIGKVFASPTEKIFNPEPKNSGIKEKHLKQLAEIIGTVVNGPKR